MLLCGSVIRPRGIIKSLLCNIFFLHFFFFSDKIQSYTAHIKLRRTKCKACFTFAGSLG